MNALAPTIETVNVTPALAKEWLTRNKRNRPASSTVIEKYRRDMADGNWHFTGDAIRFDSDGVLLDGQHRLVALSTMDPDYTLPLLVIRDLDTRSQLVMDQGRRRTPGQQLALLGVKNANLVAAAAKISIIWEEGLMFRDNRLRQLTTSAQIERWVDTHPQDVAALTEAFTMIRAVDASPSVVGAAYIRFHNIDADAAKRFISSLGTGANLSEGDPILTLKNRLHKIRRESITTSERDLLAFLILAWNAHRSGKSMTKFQRPRGGKWNVNNFPEPR